MTVMTLPKKLQKERRVDSAHGSNAPRNESVAKVERVTESAPVREVDAEEKCPVIRANRIVFSSGRTGRTRVVFY